MPGARYRTLQSIDVAARSATTCGGAEYAGPANRSLGALVPAFVGVVTLATFSPALWFAFVEWDDFSNFVTNAGYRGLTWTHLQWMLTSVHGGHWIPATWATLGLDYVIWGTDPFGYHLTNVLLHVTNAMFVFFVARRLLRAAMPDVSCVALQWGAGAAALLFSLHPLRVESVAWVTERRDVLSGLFWLLAVLAYLRAPERSGQKSGAWKLASLLCFLVAVMAKSITVTLPVVLLVLDVYPLRRAGERPLRLLLEKTPYLPIVLMGVGMALVAAPVTPLNDLSFGQRVALSAYSVSFYIATTIFPSGLSPLYELPRSIDLVASRFLVPFITVATTTIVAFMVRRRWPGLLAAWMAYVVMISPVSGMLHRGLQLVADRYSYLSCLPWALLFGALVALVATRILAGAPPRVVWRFAAIASLCVLGVLPVLAWRQLPVWRNGEALWQHALTVDPDCSLCHLFYGQYLRNRERAPAALEHLSRAAELRPALKTWGFFRMHRALAYMAVDDLEAAEQDLAALRAVDASLAADVSPAFIVRW